jgi:undecaprenyl-diphosphatase
MTHREAFILGIVEGLTEFLPVSSTGHLILTAHLLGLKHDEFLKSFEIAIQLGSILAVVFVYWERLIRDMEIWKRIIAAFIPTAIIGFSLYKVIKGYFIGNDLLVVVNLVLGGIVLLVADRFTSNLQKFSDVGDMSIKRSALVGVFQALAVMPGVSRSGATIVGGMILGLDRRKAAEFSFLLAIPTMLAATSYDLLKTGPSFGSEQWSLLATGFLTSFITAFLTVRAFLKFLEGHGFFIFGVYRIAIGVIYGLIFLN